MCAWSSQNDFLDVVAQVVYARAVHGGRLLSRTARQQVLAVPVAGAQLAVRRLARQEAEIWW